MRRLFTCALIVLLPASLAHAQILARATLTATTNVATVPMAGVPSASVTIGGTYTGAISFLFATPPATTCAGSTSVPGCLPDPGRRTRVVHDNDRHLDRHQLRVSDALRVRERHQ
jgi:hypothetical protein